MMGLAVSAILLAFIHVHHSPSNAAPAAQCKSPTRSCHSCLQLLPASTDVMNEHGCTIKAGRGGTLVRTEPDRRLVLLGNSSAHSPALLRLLCGGDTMGIPTCACAAGTMGQALLPSHEQQVSIALLGELIQRECIALCLQPM